MNEVSEEKIKLAAFMNELLALTSPRLMCE